MYLQNVFIHFEPLGHSLRHEEENSVDELSLENLYQQAWQRERRKCNERDKECLARLDLNVNAEAPHYILPGSLEEKRWMQAHPRAKLVRFFVYCLSLTYF